MTDRTAGPRGKRTPFGPRNAPTGSAVAILAGALSLALTGAILHLAKAFHPPTGVPTPIVSLDLRQTPSGVAAPMVGVVLLTVVGSPPNRSAGVPTPVWVAKADAGAPG
ncbi:MAG TPA: hypothetical protein VGR18_03230 [Rubrobacter sp.]|nr:hypothetical protein [Rubrobacter sp.]